MKRTVACILALMLGSMSAHAEWLMGLLGLGNNYMNASLVVEDHTELYYDGRFAFYEDGKCVFFPIYGDIPCLYDAYGDVMTELSPLPEDDEVWRGLALDVAGRINMSEEAMNARIETAGACSAYFFAMQGGQRAYSHVRADKYLLVTTNYYVFLIDTERCTIRPMPADHLLDTGECVAVTRDIGGFTFTSPDGGTREVYVEADVGYDCYVSGFGFDGASAVLLAHDINVSLDTPQAYSAIFVEDINDGKDAAAVLLGNFKPLGGPDSAVLCGEDRAILYNRSRLTIEPVLLADRNGSVQALMWENGGMRAYAPDEVRGEDGYLEFTENGAPLIPIGASDDGRYAAFAACDEWSNIVMVDLDTFESYVLIDGNEFYERVGTSALMTVYPGTWDGSDFINTQTGYLLRFIY